MSDLIFIFLAALSVISALAVITFRNPIYSALSLVTCMTALAGLYASLSAHFIAIVQIAVYAGAIMILMLFVIMLLNVNSPIKQPRSGVMWVLTLLLIGSAVVIILANLNYIQELDFYQPNLAQLTARETFVQDIGLTLFTKYVVPFEFAGIVILVALVTSVLITNKKAND